MKQNENLLLLFIFSIFIVFSFYLMKLKDSKYQTEKLYNNSILNIKKNATTKTSLILKKDELVKIYSQAITEFIKIEYKWNNKKFDTLYFGNHKYGQSDDFPDIDLPTKIENTQIRLVAPEFGFKKQDINKLFVYVNMMGWVDSKNAQFTLIVFTNGFKHEYDYFLNFSFNTYTNNFELDNIDFENYSNYNRYHHHRINLYKDGKYIAVK